MDDTPIPTATSGASGTPLDFTAATKIGARIEDSYEQIGKGKGYDHNCSHGLREYCGRQHVSLSRRAGE